MKAAAAPPPGFEDSDEERARKERERRAAQGKLYPLHPPRWLPPLLDDAEHGGGGGAEENNSVLAVYTYEDGSVYAGDWRRGMRSGWGVYDAAKPKVRYAGEWRTNRYDGLGIITYPTGNRYEGEFLGDQRHGRGLFLWKTTVRQGVAPARRPLTRRAPPRARFITAAGTWTCARGWAATTGRTGPSTRASGRTACRTAAAATCGPTVRRLRLGPRCQPHARYRAALRGRLHDGAAGRAAPRQPRRL